MTVDIEPAPCCGATDLDAECGIGFKSKPGEPAAAVVHAQWALLNGATLQQASTATGIRTDVVGEYWRHLSAGEQWDRESHTWRKA